MRAGVKGARFMLRRSASSVRRPKDYGAAGHYLISHAGFVLVWNGKILAFKRT